VKRIKKAVIPAAGWGTRFLPATKAIPKEMFPIIDKPVIQYIVEEAAEAGIDDILIVIGENKTAIQNHFLRNSELEAVLQGQHKNMLHMINTLNQETNIHFTVQKQALGLGHAISCARSFVGEEPFAVLLGDTIRKDPRAGIKPLLEIYSEKQSSVLGIEPVSWSKVSSYGVVNGTFLTDRLMTVDKLVEKPTDNPPSNLAIVGRYLLEPEIFTILETMSAGASSEIQLTDALQRLALQQDVYALICEGGVQDVGNKLGYLQAIVQEALQDDELNGPFSVFLSEIALERFSSSEKFKPFITYAGKKGS
jgi:UTP--glucose-1-phosphate uridylyltransferase